MHMFIIFVMKMLMLILLSINKFMNKYKDLLEIWILHKLLTKYRDAAQKISKKEEITHELTILS